MGREPHVVIGKAEVVAALEQDHPGDRIELACERRLVAETLDLAHRDVDGEIDLARLDRRHACGRILDDLKMTRRIFGLGPQ